MKLDFIETVISGTEHTRYADDFLHIKALFLTKKIELFSNWKSKF